MFRFIRASLTSLPLVTLPAVASEPVARTGITSVGPAMFLFTIAVALILTLLFRSAATQATRFLVRRLGDMRIRRALAARSQDVLHDFVLPGAYGGLVRVDYAIMTAGGILCIQAKHFGGVVFGEKDEAQWTNVDGVRRRRFLNPLIQNEGRSRALRKVVPDVPVANVVVFTGNVHFPSVPPANVIRLKDLESFIQKFVFGPSKVDDWDAVWMSVKSAAMTDEATRKDLASQIAFT